MTALDAFLYGMPVALMVGAGVTLWFAKRAAREIRSHEMSQGSTKHFSVPPAQRGVRLPIGVVADPARPHEVA